jgi:sec-independent protein translocase protein TatB
MFDVGFWELVVVGVVALLVIGPDKLPEVARTVGRWSGRARAYMTSVKADIDREMRLQDLQELMQHNERNSLHEIIEETKTSLTPFQSTPSATTSTEAGSAISPPTDKATP